jgi:hypothetical protein
MTNPYATPGTVSVDPPLPALSKLPAWVRWLRAIAIVGNVVLSVLPIVMLAAGTRGVYNMVPAIYMLVIIGVSAFALVSSFQARLISAIAIVLNAGAIIFLYFGLLGTGTSAAYGAAVWLGTPTVINIAAVVGVIVARKRKGTSW